MTYARRRSVAAAAASAAIFLLVVLTTAPLSGAEDLHVEWTPYDGWYNNLAHPEWGGVDSPLSRRCPSHYDDATYTPSTVMPHDRSRPRPNARKISRATMGGPTGFTSHSKKSAFLVFFGQQVVEEILDAQRAANPPEYFNIEIEEGDPLYDPDSTSGGKMFIPFLRTRYAQNTGNNPGVPRQQLNEITPWLDGGLVYGFAKAWADALRSFQGGRLKCLNEGTAEMDCHFPAKNEVGLPYANPPPPGTHTMESVHRFYLLGNPRGHENPALLSMGIMWFRYHNYWADKIQQQHPKYSDEKVYLHARQVVIAVYQHVTLNDWLPKFLGPKHPIQEYAGYKPSVFPGIVQEFQSAAMRFGHTMVTPGFYRRTANCTFQSATEASGNVFQTTTNAVRTCNSYFSPNNAHEEHGDAAHMVMGLASQLAEREDNIITPDLRGFVFGPLEASRRDLMALNIQRARDHGLGTYNEIRHCYGLDRMKTMEDIFSASAALGDNAAMYSGCKDAEGNDANCMKVALDGLNDVYDGNVEDVDLWPGGLLEVDHEGPGELFGAIIRDQFQRIRDGDRFWYNNTQAPAYALVRQYIPDILDLTVRNVVMDAFNLPEEALQADPFFQDGTKCPSVTLRSPEENSDANLEECTPPKTYDFYHGKTPTKDHVESKSRMTTLANAAGCPFDKERMRIARQHVLSTFRPVTLQGRNLLGETNFNSGTQLIITAVAVVLYILINLVVMWVYTTRKLYSKDPSNSRVRDPPPSGPHPTKNIYEYGVVVLDGAPHHRMQKNVGEAGRLSLEGDFIQLQQGDGKYLIRFEVSRVVSFQQWNNTFATLVVEPYSFDPDIKVWTCVKFDASGASLVDFLNLLLRKQPHGIIVSEVATVAELSYVNGGYVNFDQRRREVEAIFAGAAIQALSAKDDEKTPQQEDQLQNLGFQVTSSFVNRAQFIAGGYKGAVTPSPGGGETPVRAVPMSPIAPVPQFDEEEISLGPSSALSENIEKMNRLKQASQAQVGRLRTDATIRQSIVSQLATTPRTSSVRHPSASGRLLTGSRLTPSFNKALRSRATLKSMGSLQNFQFNEETLRTFATRPEIALMEFAEIFKLPSDSFIIKRMFATFAKGSDDIMSFKDLARGLSVLLGWEVDRASVIAGFFAGNRDVVDEEEVTRIVRELVGLSGHGSESSVEPIVEAIFQHVPPTLHRCSRTIPKAELEQVIMSNSALLRGETVDERLCWDLLDSNRDFGTTGNSDGRLSMLTKYKTWHESHQLEIFWLALWFLLTGLIFGERFWFYANERERGGLRRVLDLGVSFTRGAASVQAWSYAVVILPMCRHIITILRGTIIGRFVPFDKAYEFHVVVGTTAAVATAMHVFGHFFNFRHISSQTAADLSGIFRAVWWPSDFLPTFAWWLYGTVTGFSGVLLTFITVTMFSFAIKRVRQASFSLFWIIHHVMFALLYIGLVVHGSFALIQQPIWHWFFIWPLAIFILDKLIGVSQISRHLRVEKVKILPSGTVAVYIEKPLNLMYHAGQYARIQIRALSAKEYHPFTISSAPHEKHVSFHIQPVGPWTNKLRDYVKELQSSAPKLLPHARMDGPYGDGFESWSTHETILLVAGGIGLTPFMSILKDIAHKTKLDAMNAKTTKIYCVLVVRRLKEFDWLAELMREVEEAVEGTGLLEVIFYATATRANDFRSVFLEYFEETSQLFAARSALTNTRGYSIFGRPDFDKLLSKVSRKEHTLHQNVGVFTCAPPTMTNMMNSAVKRYNENRGKLGDNESCTFRHRYQNFG